MSFAYPSQRLQDWLSQQWCILRGRKIDAVADAWLLGPFGNVDVIEDRYIQRLCEMEDLVLSRNEPGSGLLPSIDELHLAPADRARLRPEVVHFYEHTLLYEFEIWSQWCGFFRPFAGLVHLLYSRRLRQLNLPLDPLDTAQGLRSEIFKLRRRADSTVKYTVWHRILKSNQQVIYSGVYSTCALPSGETCLKVIFPLPRGNATVILKVSVGENGALRLVSRGRGYGDAGFYFLLEDGKGQLWTNYLRTFHELIHVYVDPENILRTNHFLNLWGLQALQLHYRINPSRPR